MALSTVVTSLDGLDESVKGLYVEKEGAFILDITGVDDHPDVKGLKGAYTGEQEKRIKAREAADEAERKRKELEDETAKKQGEFETLYTNTLSELATERENSTLYRKNVEDGKIDLSLSSIAADLTDLAPKRDDIIALYKHYAKVVDGQVVFEVGGIPVDAEKIKAMVEQEKPWLVDGNKASGGGGGGGGNAVTKSWEEHTNAELDNLFDNDKPTYDKLKAARK